MTTLDPLLLDVLACPVDKGPLLFIEGESLLYNPRLQRAYQVRDGVPVMLVDEATEIDGVDHQRLMALAAESGAAETGQAGQAPAGKSSAAGKEKAASRSTAAGKSTPAGKDREDGPAQ